MKKLPIGIQDFKVIRDGDFYFVDKSMLIGQIIDINDNCAYLNTRPRRFGKSLNLSMIDAFFNIKYKGNTWFDGLKISEYSEYEGYKNAFPVISIDLKCTDFNDFDIFLDMMRSKMSSVYRRFSYLLDSESISDIDKKLFNVIYDRKGNMIDTAHALTDLCTLLEMHHGSKVIALIDEYDNAINFSTDANVRQKITSFIWEMMSSLLKGNDALKMGIITGVMQITKGNMFSGLNNLFVNNILSKEFDEMYGFTDDEVKQICADYGHPEKFEEAKGWYDGYLFGNAKVYNPWSILNYIQNDFEPAPYWANTSGNGIIDDLLINANDCTIEKLKSLGSGEGIVKNISIAATFGDTLNETDLIYSLMVIAGYLNAIPNGNMYTLKIPNKELYSVFSNAVIRYAFNNSNAYIHVKRFSLAILSNDKKAMERKLYVLFENMISSRVLDNEHSYQAFIAGLLMTLSGRYQITADFENGEGYYDIRMESRSGQGSNAIIEIKRSKREEGCENDAMEALRQIKDNDYTHGLKGQTVLYGIAFYRKTPYVVSEIL